MPSIAWLFSLARHRTPNEGNQEPLSNLFRPVHANRSELGFPSVVDDNRPGHHPIGAAVPGAVDEDFEGIEDS